MRSEVHRVSCLQTGHSKFITRIPDTTFGLATFLPKHYQNAIASYDLDAERLQALALHRNCGLLSDPRWGEANLVFPFAVYEAKGYKGDPREARQQACSAAAMYLDLLDALARQPGLSGKTEGAYQSPESRSSQVFALTSFGAHWHVMVGYRRPRLAREHRGRAGMSDTVYVRKSPLKISHKFSHHRNINSMLTSPLTALPANLERPRYHGAQSVGASLYCRSDTRMGRNCPPRLCHPSP
jgi:hypothetical protein